MITTELKQKIAGAMIARRENFGGSDGQYAISLGINSAVYNRIKNGETEKILADAKWISLARHLNVEIGGGAEWKTAKTPVFVSITTQLEFCQQNSALAVLCDDAGIGKTYAAEQYARTHKNVVYVDCSQVKTKQQLVRFIAKELGVGYNGMYRDVYEDLVFYLRTQLNPLIILNEAGDLNYPAFLELKGLQNKTKECCGWYMMGADGLREKINNGIRHKKVGFAEIFDRYGAKFQKIVPEGKEQREEFYAAQAAAVIKANAPEGTDIRTMLLATDSRLRRVYIEIKKQLNAN
ncbi:MAG: ATP-binding protein [Candidatus Azobacteroides sp.]|nr:ATP-binding protein [Candidatus Azobacteroides sp.]